VVWHSLCPDLRDPGLFHNRGFLLSLGKIGGLQAIRVDANELYFEWTQHCYTLDRLLRVYIDEAGEFVAKADGQSRYSLVLAVVTS
jgi:hypothetical protein